MKDSQWINVGQRLPKTDDLVIVGNFEDSNDTWICCGYYRRTTRKWYNQFDIPKFEPDIIPTHWMPLPEPPKFD